MKTLSLLILGLALSSGCERSAATPAATPASPSTTATTTAKPDNTAVNTRDRDAAAKTPIDQNENQADVDITAKIRKQVVDTKMSVNAQNIKIITQGGQVTLRGPVESEDEKKRIEEMALSVAGAGKVDSQIEVAAPR